MHHLPEIELLSLVELIKPGQLILRFGDPITNAEYSKMSVLELRDLVRNRINQLIN